MRRALKANDFEEHRTEPRTMALRSIDILPCRAVKEWKFIPCKVVDCSLHGMALVSPEAMDVGDQFMAKLKLPHGVRLLVYTVQNCTAMEKRGGHRVGAQFAGFAAQEMDEELSVVLQELSKKE